MASPFRCDIRESLPCSSFNPVAYAKAENSASGKMSGFVRCCCRCHVQRAEKESPTNVCGKSVRVTDIALAVANAASYNHVVARKLTAQLTHNGESNTVSCSSSSVNRSNSSGSSCRLNSGSTQNGDTSLHSNAGRTTGDGTEEVGGVLSRIILQEGTGNESDNTGSTTGGLQGLNAGVGRSGNRPRQAAGLLKKLLVWLGIISLLKLKERTTHKKKVIPVRNPAMPRSKVRFPEDRESLYHIIPRCHPYIFTAFFLYITFVSAFIVAPALLLLFHTVSGTFFAKTSPETTSLIDALEKCDTAVVSPTSSSFSTPGTGSRSGGTTGTCWLSSSARCNTARINSSSSSRRGLSSTIGSTDILWQSLLLLVIGLGLHVWILRYYLLHLVSKRVWPGYVERQFSVERLLFEEESCQYFSPARPISPLCGRYGFTHLKTSDPVILALISPISGGKLAMVYYQELVLPELYLLFGPHTHVVPMILEETVAHMLCAFLQKWSFVFDFALILGGDGAFHTIVNLLTKIAMEEAVNRNSRGIITSRIFHASSRRAALTRQRNSFTAFGRASRATSEDTGEEHVSTDCSEKEKCRRFPAASTHGGALQNGTIDTQCQSPSKCCCACRGKDSFYPLDLVISPVPLGTSNTWCSEFIFSHAGPIAARFYAAMARKDAARCVAQLEGGLAEDSNETAAAHAAIAKKTEKVKRAAAAAATTATTVTTAVTTPTGIIAAEAPAATAKDMITESRIGKGAGASPALVSVPPSLLQYTDASTISQASLTQKKELPVAAAGGKKEYAHIRSGNTQNAGVFPGIQRFNTSSTDADGGKSEGRRSSDDFPWGDSDLLTLLTTDSVGYTGKFRAAAEEGNAATPGTEDKKTTQREKQTERRRQTGDIEAIPSEACAFQQAAEHATAEANSTGALTKETTVTKKRTTPAEEAATTEEAARVKTGYKVAGNMKFFAEVGGGTTHGKPAHGRAAAQNTATQLETRTKATKVDAEPKDTGARYSGRKHSSSSIFERSEQEMQQSIAACAAASAALGDASVAHEMAARAALRQKQTGMDVTAGAAALLRSGSAAVEAEETAAAAAAAAREAGRAAEQVGILLGEDSTDVPEEGYASSVLRQRRRDLLHRASPIIDMKASAGDSVQTSSVAAAPACTGCTEATASPVASPTGSNALHAAAEIVALLAAEASENKKAFARLRQDSQLLKPHGGSPKQTMLHRAKYFLQQAERLDELALHIGAGKDRDMTKMGREKLLHFWLRRIRECRSTRINALLVEADGERHICCNSLEFGFIGTAQVHSEDLRWLGHMRYTGAFLYHLITMRKFCAYIEAVLPNGMVVHKIGEYMVIALDVIQHWTDDRPVARQAQMDGPCAWLLLLSGKISRARLLSYMMDLRRLSVAVDEGLEMIPVKEVKVKLNEPGIFGLDGEVYRHNGELKFTLLPGFMRVCVSEFDQMIAQPAVGHRWMKYLRSDERVTGTFGVA